MLSKPENNNYAKSICGLLFHHIAYHTCIAYHLWHCLAVYNFRTKERLALIEKGMDPNLAKSDFWVQVGIIGAGAAAGLIAGDLLPGKYGPLVAFVFAGGGLVIYNIIRKNKARNTGQ